MFYICVTIFAVYRTHLGTGTRCRWHCPHCCQHKLFRQRQARGCHMTLTLLADLHHTLHYSCCWPSTVPSYRSLWKVKWWYCKLSTVYTLPTYTHTLSTFMPTISAHVHDHTLSTFMPTTCQHSCLHPVNIHAYTLSTFMPTPCPHSCPQPAHVHVHNLPMFMPTLCPHSCP